MKRIICLLTVLCLVFGSFSFCFAAVQDVSDATTHTQLGNIYNLLNGTNFSGRLATITTKLTDINANLVTLMGWLDPSLGGSTSAILNKILNALVYTDAGGGLISWLYSIDDYNYQQINKLSDLLIPLSNISPGASSYTSDQLRKNSHINLVDASTGRYNRTVVGQNGTYTVSQISWSNGSPLGNIAYLVQTVNNNLASIYNQRWNSDVKGFNTAQTYTRWDDLTTSTFTPQSSTDGLYNWLSNIQSPVARLSYVLASDERIEAQEAAAANEEAVVDNFIDSSGAGSASPSDIGSISDLSSGYQNNFGSDASVSGIFNIFNSNNMGWFSQETANQLDTTVSTRRGSSFETPLLDQQIEDIYDQIGVKHD